METIFLVLLYLGGLTSIVFLTRELIHLIMRKRSQAKRKRTKAVLYGVNPRSGRRIIYETAAKSQQKLSWLVAQNRRAVADGIKEFAEVFSVDNRHMEIDTFGLRRSVHKEQHLIKKTLHLIRSYGYGLYNSRIATIIRTNRRIQCILQVSKKLYGTIRSIIRKVIRTPKLVVGGESAHGKDKPL
jgi:hypothetical protein